MTTIKIDGNYKVENFILAKELPEDYSTDDIINLRNSVIKCNSYEDSLAFLRLRYPLFDRTVEMLEKFKEECNTLKKTPYGEFNTNSLKAWIKRNDFQRLIDTFSSFPGRCRLTIGGWRFTLSSSLQFNNLQDFVEKVMPFALREACIEELKVYKETSAYYKDVNRCRDYMSKYSTAFKIKHTVFDSHGNLFVYDEADRSDMHKITEEEISYLLHEYKLLEQYIESRIQL